MNPCNWPWYPHLLFASIPWNGYNYSGHSQPINYAAWPPLSSPMPTMSTQPQVQQVSVPMTMPVQQNIHIHHHHHHYHYQQDQFEMEKRRQYQMMLHNDDNQYHRMQKKKQKTKEKILFNNNNNNFNRFETNANTEIKIKRQQKNKSKTKIYVNVEHVVELNQDKLPIHSVIVSCPQSGKQSEAIYGTSEKSIQRGICQVKDQGCCNGKFHDFHESDACERDRYRADLN